MTLTAVAARYAQALADVVTSPASPLPPAQALEELRWFDDALSESRSLREALATPAVPTNRKKAVVGSIAEKLGISPIIRNFLFVLVDHRRVGLLTSIIRTLDLVLEERMGFARAEISVPVELTETQRAALQVNLDRLTGKRIRPHFAIDPSLIGGVVARIGSTIYDGSVRGRLQSLEQRLSAEP
jgi:F-type H+-transporting ATPase subunit delta